MPRGLFLFLLAVHQLSNDFCHKEKQHANSGPSRFYLPLPSLPATTRLFLLLIPTLLNVDQLLTLLIHSLPVVGRLQLYFSNFPSFCHCPPHCRAWGRQVHRQDKDITEIRPGR